MLGDTAVAVQPDPAAALDKLEKELATKESSEKDKAAIQPQIDDIADRRSARFRYVKNPTWPATVARLSSR
jgi:valyl-tRNA synthetase